MVVKKTWNELLTETNGITGIIDTTVINLGKDVDTSFNTKYEKGHTNLEGLLRDIKDYFLTSSDNNVWKELNIFMSSYKLKDFRFCRVIRDNLIKYLIFINKMINDEGIKRRMSTSRSFSNGTSSESEDKNYFSETPQATLDNFETAIIKYASNLGKNDVTSTTRQNGSNTENVNSANWEEEFKNLEFAFYNDLADYITRIPDMLYNNFCLDSRPCTEIRKASREAIKDLFNL